MIKKVAENNHLQLIAISVQGCHLNSRNSQRGLGTNTVTNIKLYD